MVFNLFCTATHCCLRSHIQGCSDNSKGTGALLGIFASICRQRLIIHWWRWRSSGSITPLPTSKQLKAVCCKLSRNELTGLCLYFCEDLNLDISVYSSKHSQGGFHRYPLLGVLTWPQVENHWSSESILGNCCVTFVSQYVGINLEGNDNS